MAEDYLTLIKKCKRKEIEAYQKLSDALDDFEEKYEKQGIHFTTLVDYKTKSTLTIRLTGVTEDYSFMDPIIEEFMNEFHVELVEKVVEHSIIHEDVSVVWIFKSVYRWE